MDNQEPLLASTSSLPNQKNYSLEQLPKAVILLICFIAGTFIPLSLAPFNVWPLGILALAIFYFFIQHTNRKTLFIRSWFFGLGTYSLGVSWVYVSIHWYGGASIPLALFLVAIFVSGLSLVFALPFVVFHRLLQTNQFKFVLAFATLWLFNEWLRSWFLTGLPWLYVGYAHLTGFFSGFAPIFSVLGIGFLMALVSGLFALIIKNRFFEPANETSKQKQRATHFICVGVILVILAAGYSLSKIQWTQIDNQSIGVAIVQPNIDQDDKWQEENLQPTLSLLYQASKKLWEAPNQKNRIIVWPESAVPLPYNEAISFLNQINRESADHHVGIVTGVIYDDRYQEKYFNSVTGLGEAIGIYHKRRLVPFGEYVPLEHWLRGLIEFFDLPTSIISFGDESQPHLKFEELYIAPSVCYEVAYPELVAKSAQGANVILSVSNLGWFRDSLGRHQFMQMAQMRALETQRYHIYSTNNGPSAVFDPRGKSVSESDAFAQTTLEGKIYSVSGNTPYMIWGNWPLILFMVSCLTGLLFLAKRSKEQF